MSSKEKTPEQLDTEIEAAAQEYASAKRRLEALKEQREFTRRVPTEAELAFLSARQFIPQQEHTPPRKWVRAAVVDNALVSVYVYLNHRWGVGVHAVRESTGNVDSQELDEYCQSMNLEEAVETMLTYLRRRAAVLASAQLFLTGHTDE